MEYELPDSSGTDDDLPPSHFNRVPIGGHVAGNGRPIVGSAPYPRMHNDMESQIHLLEQEAYSSVLRAFKAQSDALTWEKEGLITELRKELRVSDDEHRDLLSKVNTDDIICRIREWRKVGGSHSAMLNVSQSIHDQLPSPTVSASRKKQKTSQSVPLPFGMPSQALHPQSIAATTQPSSLTTKWGPGGRKPKPGQPRHGLSSMNSTRYPSTGQTPRGQLSNHGFPAIILTNESAEAACNPLIGRKVMTRWPDDNNFYEAIISDYNPGEGRHALVYDRGTANETWEWVNFKEFPPEDIRWVDEDPGICRQSGHGGVKNPMSHGAVPSSGRGKGSTKGLFEKEFPPPQNGVVKKVSEDIEILHTDTLIKEVEKVFGSSHLDLFEIEKAKKMLKDHEQALIDVIAKLADASDSESDGEQQFLNGQSVDREQGHRYVKYSSNQCGPNIEADTRGGKADGCVMVRGYPTASYNQQDDDIVDIE